MATVRSQILTVKDFLTLPELKPALEFFDGRIIQKMSPRWKHGVIQAELGTSLTTYAKPRRLGRVISELRCTFGGDSHVPDLVFYIQGRLPGQAEQDQVGGIVTPPDLAIEILSPGQTVSELTRKLRAAIRHGVRLGWLIDDRRREVHVLRPAGQREILRAGEILTGEDILPGYSLPIDELFGWLSSD